jgi:prolyl-tRNA synthetase
MRGVPIRLELGPRDLAAGTAMMVRRLGGDGKQATSIDSLPEIMPGVLDEFQAFLLARATEFRDSHTRGVERWEDFADAVSTGWARALHCGTRACEEDIKSVTAATPRCIPLDGEPADGVCVRCGAASAYSKRVIFGRAY